MILEIYKIHIIHGPRIRPGPFWQWIWNWLPTCYSLNMLNYCIHVILQFYHTIILCTLLICILLYDCYNDLHIVLICVCSTIVSEIKTNKQEFIYLHSTLFQYMFFEFAPVPNHFLPFSSLQHKFWVCGKSKCKSIHHNSLYKPLPFPLSPSIPHHFAINDTISSQTPQLT